MRSLFWRRVCTLTAVACVGVFSLGVGSAAAAGGTFVWTGATTSPDWSTPGNWAGDVAPSGAVDSLDFPESLTSGDCADDPRSDTCYSGTDDITGLATTAITIDDEVGYSFGGSVALTIGSGGITTIVATTAYSFVGPAEIDSPIVLDAAQTWSIDGGTGNQGQLNIGGGVTGTADALVVVLRDAGTLSLSHGTDNEVGDVTIIGADVADTGLDAPANGVLLMGDGGELNAGDSHPVQLDRATIMGTGSLGPVTSNGGAILVGDPVGTLAVDGSLTLDTTSVLEFAIANGGTTPGTDYSHLTTTGNLNPGGAALEITDDGDPPTYCSYLVLTYFNNGERSPDTLITASGAIVGTFSSAPYSDDEVGLACPGGPGVDPTLLIMYSDQTVTATAVYPGTSLTEMGLSLDPDNGTPYAGNRVTVTAIVSAGIGAPSGTVSFTDGGSPIPGCTAQPVVPSGPYVSEATCSTTYGAAWSSISFQASFSPAPQTPLNAVSASLPSVTVSATPTTEGIIHVGKADVTGRVAQVPVTCSVAPGYGLSVVCEGRGVLTATARRRAGRTIVIGHVMFDVSSAAGETERVSLDSAGRRLQRKRRALVATLKVSNLYTGNNVISTQRVTF